MRRRLLFVSVLTLTMAGHLLPTPARAEAPSQIHARGGTAFALFSSADPVDPCLVTDVFVLASTGRVQEPPGPASPEAFGFVNIFRFSACTGERLLVAINTTTTVDLQIDRPLTSAHLTATITVEDFVSGSTFDVFFDLAWTGTGDVAREASHVHFQSPGFVFYAHFNGTTRPAAASGSVSDGATDFTAGEPAEFAEIAWANGGRIDLEESTG